MEQVIKYFQPERVPKGKFVKGIYALTSNEDVLKAKSLADLRRFTSVTNTLLIIDWQTLEKMIL